MTKRAVAGLLAGIAVTLLAVGLLFGLSSVSQYGVNCGSALGGTNGNAMAADFQNVYTGSAPNGDPSAVENACTSAVANRKPLVWALLIPGGIALVAAIVVLGYAMQETRSTVTAQPYTAAPQ